MPWRLSVPVCLDFLYMDFLSPKAAILSRQANLLSFSRQRLSTKKNPRGNRWCREHNWFVPWDTKITSTDVAVAQGSKRGMVWVGVSFCA